MMPATISQFASGLIPAASHARPDPRQAIKRSGCLMQGRMG